GTEMPTAGWWEALWPDPAAVLAAVGIKPGMDVIDLLGRRVVHAANCQDCKPRHRDRYRPGAAGDSAHPAEREGCDQLRGPVRRRLSARGVGGACGWFRFHGQRLPCRALPRSARPPRA